MVPNLLTNNHAGIHLRAISQEMLKMSVLERSLKIADLNVLAASPWGPLTNMVYL